MKFDFLVEKIIEMKQWYKKRTNNHIQLVGKYCDKIVTKFPEFKELKQRKTIHDDSKFKEPEYTAYVWLTWQYKCKDTGENFESFSLPKNIDELMNKATHHHITSNSHHPEFYSPKKNDLLNCNDRDKPPDEIIDATKMPDIDVAEMVADWSAMSEERGNTPKEWADKNVNIRWKFTDKQKDLIYKLINVIW